MKETWEIAEDASGPGAPPGITLEVMQENLYRLDREELRRLAWEALLISDGPDKVPEPNKGRAGTDSAFSVGRAFRFAAAPVYRGFHLYGKNGWTT
jgi:hypothetical protein